MSAGGALSGVQFRHFTGPTHTVEAWSAAHADTEWAKARPETRDTYAGSAVDPGHRPLGSLSWHAGTGEIRGVYVVPQRQRQGLATSLLSHAQHLSTEQGLASPQHAPDRTASGDAWARSVGGYVPPLRSGVERAKETHPDAFAPTTRRGQWARP